MRGSTVLVLLLLLVSTAPGATQRGVSEGPWRHYRGDAGGTSYSHLDQITASNASKLGIAWRWTSANFGPAPEFKNETTPLYVDGVLYFTAGARRDVVAIDAGTAETLWTYRLDEGERGKKAPRKNSGRGVAYWSDGRGDARVLVITPGFHLVALDAKTGRPIPDFGIDGIVDLKLGFDQEVDLDAGNLGSSSPGVVFEDLIVVGPAMASAARLTSKTGVPGHVTAWDLRTGKRRWIFHTVPKRGEYGYETWENGSASYTGHAAVWAPISLDEALGYLYLPVEVATSDYYGGHRLGDNLFSSSLVCLNARTGERVWHQQIVHHDVFEYDLSSAPILMDLNVEGRPVKAVVQLTKQSFAFSYDRTTGKPIWPIEERAVPASDVPGERTSPTQPFPTKPAPLDRTGVTEEDLIDLTPAIRDEALSIARRYRMGPLYSPPSLAKAPDGTQGTIELPGTGGGALWEGGAVDVETGMLYVGTLTSPTLLSLQREADYSDLDYVSAGLVVPGPGGLPLFKPPFGRITAVDMNTGLLVWMKPNGGTPPSIRDHPSLKGVALEPTGSPSRAVLLVTRTLLFAGEGWTGEPFFRAYDKRTGDVLAEIEIPAQATSVPMTYLHRGRQYIVFAAGDAESDHAAELVALALPDGGTPVSR
jgi:quinoprotein glucose dehydrogenase